MESVLETIPEIIPEQPTAEQFEREGFDALEQIFHIHEDNYNMIQDEPLLVIINNEFRVSDKIKIKFLFKKYRDEARDNHGC